MFAVIKAGGKQYKVVANDEITVEKIDKDAGDEHAFDEVLMLGEGDDVTVGEPTVKGAAVVGEVMDQTRDDKIIIFKKRQRSTYKRKKGHRQLKTVIKITAILPEGADVKKLKKAGKETKDTEVKALEAEAKKAEKKAAPKAEKAEKPAPKKETAAPAKNELGLLVEPQGEADDLKKIGGVGPAIEKKLNALGIFHFWQIAEFDADMVAKVDEHLNFKGRIERDDWISQAKELAKGE